MHADFAAVQQALGRGGAVGHAVLLRGQSQQVAGRLGLGDLEGSCYRLYSEVVNMAIVVIL